MTPKNKPIGLVKKVKSFLEGNNIDEEAIKETYFNLKSRQNSLQEELRYTQREVEETYATVKKALDSTDYQKVDQALLLIRPFIHVGLPRGVVKKAEKSIENILIDKKEDCPTEVKYDAAMLAAESLKEQEESNEHATIEDAPWEIVYDTLQDYKKHLEGNIDSLSSKLKKITDKEMYEDLSNSLLSAKNEIYQLNKEYLPLVKEKKEERHFRGPLDGQIEAMGGLEKN